MSKQIEVTVDPIIRPFAETYRTETLSNLDRLEQLFENSDYVQIREIAHRLKGEGGTYGFDEVSKQGQLLQKMCDDGDFAAIPGVIQHLRHFLLNVRIC
ncbi:Hpt domain-containing protein [Salinispira pacifica]|uniref:HPt domain-containing protein n=1 Tax=Salinispira pacifica TaxID=1307761 RepID=V5WJH5_9SPIO|nr:Hpt domain-containing protein [Salinispira pacifica]AHC15709.1 hypothetical protein L21SP2_2356 [Salinispira pacifica]